MHQEAHGLMGVTVLRKLQVKTKAKKCTHIVSKNAFQTLHFKTLRKAKNKLNFKHITIRKKGQREYRYLRVKTSGVCSPSLTTLLKPFFLRGFLLFFSKTAT